MIEKPSNTPPGAGKGPVYSADKVRQGYTVLRTPVRKFIFFGGFIGLLFLGFVMALYAPIPY